MTRSTPRRPWRTLLAALALVLAPTLASAQTGTIRGTVTGPSGAAVVGARVTVVNGRAAANTDVAGRFTLGGVAAGAHQVRVTHLGHQAATQAVTVAEGGDATVDFRLLESALALDAVVVSATREAQRITDAPASITKVGLDVLDQTVGNTWAGALKQVNGLDFVQVGVTSVALNARGFNSSFNNRMLMMEDGRLAVLPENGLPVGQFTAIPKVDLAGIEVLVGPGSALYGADASNGVVALQTKDAREMPGTTVEFSGGSRDYLDLQARHAFSFGRWAIKAAGEYQTANDFENFLTYNINVGGTRGIVPVREDTIPGGNALDFGARVARGTGAVSYYLSDNQRIQVSAGASQSDGVGQTNVGRNQLRDWTYNFLQAQYTSPRLYANLYRTQSKSGESFAINRYADALARNPSLSADSLRMLSDWPSDGRLMAAELQTNFRIPQLGGTRVVVGGQFRRDQVSSSRQWLTDRQTGEDISIDQRGIYAQATQPIGSRLDLVGAVRLDDHDNYESQFSPKAGFVFRPVEGQAVRLTYNRAFKSPTILQTNFFIPDWTAVIAIFGNTQGFSIRDANGLEVASYDPLQPEENTTWELGYRGVLGGNFFVDFAAYRSEYEGFLSPLAIIADPFGFGLAGQPAGTRWYAHGPDGQRLKNHNNADPIVLTYYNLGHAELHGFDLGLNWVVSPQVSLRANASLLKQDEVEVPANRAEATALNSPERKLTLGANFQNFGRLGGAVTLRHVDDYYFRSGINMGVVPSFTTLDASLTYRVPQLNSLVSLSVSNLFSCTRSLVYAGNDPLRQNPAPGQRRCGFGEEHLEMINMPQIGGMVFLGMRFETR
jgi:outer membrane receptor for ferrienterochelin and colicins